ncbi:ExeA family protein [soil metagenome]
MYAQHFGLRHEPFSIAPDPRYLFMSEQHREALAHLLYGVGGGGGFVLLTGEVGAGKTTVCRCFLEQIPKRCNVAYIFNPKLTVGELLKSICEEFRIPFEHTGPEAPTVKDYLDPLNEFLLKTHAVGQNSVLIIDEAQNLSSDVLEQLRLLTNLETSERKLLQIVLIGQPELRDLLARPELEQLAQRVIARFHLEALTEAETSRYIRHRLSVAGLSATRPFDRKAVQRIHRLSRGIPRRINLLADRALLGAYAKGRARADVEIVDKAASEVFGKAELAKLTLARYPRHLILGAGVVAGVVLAGVIAMVAGAFARGPVPQPDAVAATSAAASVPTPPMMTAPVQSVTPTSALPSDSQASGALATVTTTAASQPAPTSPLRDQRQAWRELARLWKLPPDVDDPCRAATTPKVQCFKGTTTMELIRVLDRPGILTLQDASDRPVYALLTGLTDKTATLHMGAAGELSQTVSLVTLQRMWRGEFATLWRTPPGYSAMLSEGASGPAVQHLAVQLAALQGGTPPPNAQPFDATVKSQVNAFQQSHGLKPDGVAGPTTFMLLNRATGVDEPRLATGA